MHQTRLSIQIKHIFLILFALLMTACGGGGSNPAPTVVPVPQNLQAVAGDRQVSLSWDAVSGANSYSIYSINWNSTDGFTTGDLITVTNNTSAILTGLTNGINYTYAVLATTSAGSSALSAADAARPKLPPPGLSDWQWLNPTPQGNTLHTIISDGSQFVSVGDYGTILTSIDGATWTTRISGSRNNLYGITWDGSQFMAVGYFGTILTSPDAVTW
ncbi:MAG: fibronectin type III domain-containing protein, partial [Gammaproteobacteria bacterium]|nr:fibronectin type III domain-containing protein [Gammaproteobacteria bacterium]